MRKVLSLAILALMALPAHAVDDCTSTAQTVVAPCVAELTNGFEIRAVRREVVGDNVRLYVSPESYTEVPAARIAAYTPDLTPPPAPAAIATPVPASLDENVRHASDAHGIDADFIRSVIRAESGANPRAVSSKGAQGLMQLMPGTAAKLGVKDAFDPAQNVNGGTQYLRELLVRYNGDAVKALAAYNAGPDRVDQYKGVPPYTETRHYVASIIRDYNRRKLAEAKTKPKRVAKSSPATTNKGE